MGEEAARLEALRLAINLGADFVDVELKVFDELYDHFQSESNNVLVKND